MDDEFTEDELDDIIFEVRSARAIRVHSRHKLYLVPIDGPKYTLAFQVDADGSGTIDFDEFVKIMT